MGVPKFYRWVSERYPCLSETVKEFQIPEFDNLYLDMNGIIHGCSHPEDGNPHFRITEEKIFADIMHYLEFLFCMIKPRKVFFMAVDGVAPRAKMNQQRGRRFRSAREAKELEWKAKEKGETLPSEKRFDSNCITPGTQFMVRLQEQLQFFVVDKLITDPLWRGVRVYLSGHDTPGEGEHKIMDFIRAERSRPGYDPNTRHCLYGLDADLMMLGLASHETHFSLMREEVRFGGRRDRGKRSATFHLLHLSRFREYLDFEFSALKDKVMTFEYNLENIIDDWVLMGFLVGNDFIPHLPNLHINHEALPLLWQTYIDVLPSCGGYLNEGGHLNLERFEKYLAKLSEFDMTSFSKQAGDLKCVKGKKLPWTELTDTSPEDISEEFPMSDDEFRHHKRHYYMSKLEYDEVTPEILKDLAECYVRGIQWILLYYYQGVPSWSWFYPHHYAPYMSDVKDFKNMVMEFDLASPFLPFEQLMAVLPAASREFLPKAFQSLMTMDNSPVIDFYPLDFETDLNGKQQDWEAVVLIPFIDENRLLSAMRLAENQMTEEEKWRNTHREHCVYEYSPKPRPVYQSKIPEVFPDIVLNHSRGSSYRGYRMPPSAVLNLTHGERKNGVKPPLTAQTENQASNFQGNQHRNMGGHPGSQNNRGGYQNFSQGRGGYSREAESNQVWERNQPYSLDQTNNQNYEEVRYYGQQLHRSVGSMNRGQPNVNSQPTSNYIHQDRRQSQLEDYRGNTGMRRNQYAGYELMDRCQKCGLQNHSTEQCYHRYPVRCFRCNALGHKDSTGLCLY